MKDWHKLTETERLLYRELFKKDCYTFCCEFWEEVDSHPLVEGKLLRFFCEAFQYSARYWIAYKPPKIKLPEIKVGDEVIDVRGNKNYLSMSCPPRHGKSNFFNVLCPVWLFVNSPIKVASVSHTQNLAGTMNAKRQKLLNSEKFKYFFPEISLIVNTSYSLKDTRNGEMYSVPKNSITGFGADFLCIDDLTNVSQATRDAKEMESAWDTYTNTLPSRINDPNKFMFINIMQRIAPNDIVGRIQNDPKLRNAYTFVTLPAQFKKRTYMICPISGTVYTFNEGDYLFPERFGDYEALRSSISESTWNAQYMQNPQNSDLSIIKSEMIIEKDEPECPEMSAAEMIYASHDFPVKDKETSDFLGSVMGYRIGTTLYITDCLEKRMAFVKSVEYVEQLDGIFPGIIQIIEDKANGSPILQQLQDRVSGMQAYQPGTSSKTQRLESASIYLSAKNIVFVKNYFNSANQKWELSSALQNLKERLLAFPFVEHDDIIDAFSMLILFVYMDRRYMVYGKSFNDKNIIDALSLSLPYSTIFFNREGDIWKILEISVDYGEQTRLIVRKEMRFRGTVEDGLSALKKFGESKTVFIDCSATEALNDMILSGINIVRYSIDDFEKSVANIDLAFNKKLILVDKRCVLTKTDIESFKFAKSKDETVKYLSTKDGFVSCIRTAIKYYGGIV